MVGRTLGHYEIIEPLGAGGMGEVYRARDTKLDRDVAIKVLPEDFAADQERLARFEREAKLFASLNHANIAAIYGLEDFEGVRFIAMECVEGETLAKLLAATGRIEVDETLEIARQIAEALEAAHEGGVIHRDLKPANVMVTPEGKVKVLDFGLAKAYEADCSRAEISPDLSQSPTVADATRTGVILGTAAYMSPEQARGKPLDKRTDIWSFGCVLYEMLARRRAFEGEDVSDTLASILRDDPDWGALPDKLPSVIRLLLPKCLEKNSHRRLHDIADARIDIVNAINEPEGELPGIATVIAKTPLWWQAIPWGLAAMMALVAGVMYTRVAPPPESPPVDRYNIEVETGHRLWGGHPSELDWTFLRQRPSRTALALSPDGRHLAYAATDGERSQLYLRAMNQARATPIPDTEGGCCPFFSPDGRSIGFFASEESDGTERWSLMRVPIGGGEARTVVAEVERPLGASWADNSEIVFADGVEGGLLRVSAEGGTPQALTEVDRENGETGHRLPHVLPGSQAVLFTVTRGVFGCNEAEVAVQSLETGRHTMLAAAGAYPLYVPATGHLVFAREGTLMAVPFDSAQLEVRGEPKRVLEDVMQACYGENTWIDTGAAQLSFSGTGSLVYAPGGVYPEAETSLVWVSRNGEPEVIPMGSGQFWNPRISPDGRYLAYVRGRSGQYDLWVYDIQRETSPTRLTSQRDVDAPVWSPDSRRIAFSSTGGDSVLDIFILAADGTGDISPLTASSHDQYPASWSPEGMLAFLDYPVDSGADLWMLSTAGEGSEDPELFLDSPANLWHPTFSPDGRWLAYASNEADRWEVYVQPYPGPGRAVSISIGGGSRPAWSRIGRELFYRETTSRMMVVDYEVAADGSFDAGKPRLLFEGAYRATYPLRNYDVSSDGRFVMGSYEDQPEPQPVTQINIVLNWFEELKRVVSTNR